MLIEVEEFSFLLHKVYTIIFFLNCKNILLVYLEILSIKIDCFAKKKKKNIHMGILGIVIYFGQLYIYSR